MSTPQVLNRIILFAFLALVGFAIAMGIYYESFLGISLALIALSACVYFIYILAKARKELEEAESSS